MSETEYTIQPVGKWVRLPFREVWEYRDLLMLLVRRDFVAKYKQTILGPVWFIIQPLMTTVVFTVVFKKMAGLSTDGYPGLLFYLSGMTAWQYFSQCLQGTASTFVMNQHLFGKVYFPRIVVPLSVVISNLLAYALQLMLLVAFLVYFKVFTWAGDIVRPSSCLFALPVVLLHTAGLGLGVGLWMSALTAKYRDFSHLMGFLNQLWMFSTLPLFMSLSEIPARFQWVLAVNPVCPIVQFYRMAFLGAPGFDLGQYGVSVVVSLGVLVTGLLLFARTERTFIDTV